MKAFFDGESMVLVNHKCANCGEDTPNIYCSLDCKLDGEGLELCDEGHEHAAGEDCPECERDPCDTHESRHGYDFSSGRPRED